MTLRMLAASLGIALALGLPRVATAQDEGGSARTNRIAADDSKPGASEEKANEPGKADRGEAKTDGAESKTDGAAPKTEFATFGGGCFWCLEAVFERIKGVKSVVSGYAGGNVPNPSYDMVCTGLTGHAEVVQIEYDPAVVSYEELLKVFWKSHDPTTLNAQGPDYGTQYRSIILYHDEAQRQVARKSYQKLTAARVYRDPIVTELVPFTKFYPAEPYHQDYYRNHKYADYCQAFITPKLRKLNLLPTRSTGRTATKKR